MKKFEYSISVSASCSEEARKKIIALCTLCEKLKTNELEKLAHIVKNDPIKTAMAKRALGV